VFCVSVLARAFPSSSALLMSHHKHLQVRIYNMDGFLLIPLQCSGITLLLHFVQVNFKVPWKNEITVSNPQYRLRIQQDHVRKVLSTVPVSK
jgi:hypothetical protein